MKKILKNKKILLSIIIILVFVSYFGYKKLKANNQEPLYILDKVKKGDLKITVSGTGNIISENEFNLKTKANGEVVYVGVKNGDFVEQGQLIIKLDTSDIEKQIRNTEEELRNAEIALESAKLSLDKFESQYLQVVRGDNYKKALNDGLTLLISFYNFYPNYIKNIYDIYFEKELDNYYNNLKIYEFYNKNFSGRAEKLEKEYSSLKNNYQTLAEKFRNLDKNNNSELESLIRETEKFVVLNYDFINQGFEMVSYLKEQIVLTDLQHEKQIIIDNHYNLLNSYLNNFDEYKKNFFNIVNQINSYYDIINNYEFDKKSQELNIKQKETTLISIKNKLTDLEEKLNDYYLYAPFSGKIANFNVKKGDIINSGTNLGVLISNQKIAEISLSEVDVANVKIGQEAVLTFDALQEIKIKGKVIEINPLAKIEQGVVNYQIKIALQEDDQRIKNGMSVEAEIITNQKKDILLVPNSAIKQNREGKYVEVVLSNNLDRFNRGVKLQPSQINKKYIKTGFSNNEFTEILEGLTEGEIIIVKTIEPKQNNQSQQRNLFTPQFRFGQPRR
jgi:RND family efflux transporter MFP subunit